MKKELFDKVNNMKLSELDKLLHGNVDDRLQAAEFNYRLDILVNDTSDDVRCEVAIHGYGLDKLVNDPSLCVRMTVAIQEIQSNKDDVN